MLELARQDARQPYTGSRSQFGEFVRRVRREQQQDQAVADVPVRFEGLPGEYLQVDWGEIRAFPFTQQPPVTRYFLACRLKYSRWVWVRFTTDMRQETLFRGLVDCFVELGWVPWVLTFDNMKTVTTGRDAQGQPVWHPALLQVAAEFGFHPEACTPGAGNQKGSVESLVKWVKGNFLAGRTFADDADLARQGTDWLVYANARLSQATGEAPVHRLAAEAAKGGELPATARAGDYGVLHPAQVNPEALVAVLGNQYSVPILHVGAPVVVRVHRDHLVIWRDTTRLAEHARAPDGAHQRVVVPEHYSLLFAKKPRAQVMLYREALIQLGQPARWYMSELSHRRRAHLQDEVVGVYTLWQQVGAERLLAAMTYASERTAYGVAYLQALLARPTLPTFPAWPRAYPESLPIASSARDTTPAAAPTLVPAAGLPGQEEVDRALHLYEAYVCVDQANANERDRRNGNANAASAPGTAETGAAGLSTPTMADVTEAPR
jgi:transposase